MSKDPRDPINRNGGFDPFNDPFFRQFEDIQRHMDNVFRDFFDNKGPSIFSGHDPNMNHEHNDHPFYHNRNQNKPDLSAINPNVETPNNNNNNDNNYNNNNSQRGGLFEVFKHFFEPEYDDHKLSDINPNLSDNGPIMKNDEDNKGLVHRDDIPPGFRSPYLPNWNGVEKEIPKSYFRSQSVVIATGPDGKTTKTTTVRDSNGETTTTEEIDNGHNNDKPNIFNYNRDQENDDNNFQIYPHRREYPPLFERTDDPFEKFRNLWQKWKWNPFPWKNKNNDNNDTEWFWKRNKNNDNNNNVDLRNNNSNNNNHDDGFKWRPYRDYRSSNKKPPNLRDFVKNDDD